ncbi:ATP-dependent RNA helicase dbp6 [Colletotrichum sp. CLE4]
MYARYVPSKKKEAQAPVEPSSPPPPPPPPPASEPSATPASEPVVTEGTTAAVPYARFVPSKKPRASISSFAPESNDVLSPATKRKHEEPVETLDTPVKKKKSRKSEGDAVSDEDKTTSKKFKKSESEGTKSEKKKTKKHVSEVPAVEAGSDGEDTKEKKDKKKKKKDRGQDEDAEDDAIDRRHKDVLAKATKYLKKSAELIAKNEAADKMDVDEEEEKEEEYDLVPLPQPEPTALDTSKPSYETLPTWLAAPIRVAPDTRTPFADIGINPKAAQILESKGFKDAFAVQTAALPLLLPSCKHRQGDLLIAAATGSGKTLAYALPIVRDISQGAVTRLRALVVLPTRELVKQAQEGFELCASAFDGREQKRVRIGISIGSQQLKHEQTSLVEKGEKYDPEAYRAAHQRELEAWKNVEDTAAEDEDAAVTKPTAGSLPDHVVDYTSKVDVLICTPGRLVEHINLTPGFSLDYVRWMVVDEADKLLAQSFQGWLDTVMPKLSTNKFSARDFPDSNLSGVRKVVLSATLTRDLTLLSGLQLRRPQLIVLEGDKADGTAPIAEHTLPTLLKESAIRVHDANLKPLYLIDLLLDGHLMSDTASKTDSKSTAEDDAASSSDDSSDSDSDSDSDSSSDASSTAAATTTSKSPSKPFTTTALIFTKSNESALRLSLLISLLHPALAPSIATLTSTQKTSDRRRALRAFASRRLRLLVASDLVARGIDLPLLDNVINYDLPASAAGYVHRVGRTARAGRAGAAWTLVEDGESGWFWGKIAKPSSGIRRADKVDRLRIGDPDSGGFEEERVQKYEDALEKLGKEAGEARRQR